MDRGLFTSGSAEPSLAACQTSAQPYTMHEYLAKDLQIHDGTLQQLYAHGN
jgi:hypothetical protein